MLHEDEIMGVHRGEVCGLIGALGHPVSETVNGDEHGRAGLEVLLHSWGGGGSVQLSPQSLEDLPGQGGILEAQLGQVFEGRGGLETGQTDVLLGDLEAGQNLAIGLDGAGQEGGDSVGLVILCRLAALDRRVGSVSRHKVACYYSHVSNHSTIRYPLIRRTIRHCNHNPVLKEAHSHSLQ